MSSHEELMQDVGHPALNEVHGEIIEYAPPANSIVGAGSGSTTGISARITRLVPQPDDNLLIFEIRANFAISAVTPERRGLVTVTNKGEQYAVTNVQQVGGEWQVEAQRTERLASNSPTSQV